ncbi:hypothetical protein T03_13814 [Trichinella britovi]|uniref:Uncharacterized protein n=1 Tax=Trichinella britovi TaxID=45882 RepID=A0A0V1C767_TRIBR|nr:hypothetical protein T03_13814 [Trichinella britovi]
MHSRETRRGLVPRSREYAKNNTRATPARSLSRRLAALSRGQRGPLLRPDLSRSRDYGERAIKAAAVRPKGMEVVMRGSLRD